MIKPRLYRGMRDYLPEDMIPREDLISRIKAVFRLWGFVPIETPAIELTEILNASKMGTEATKLIYHIVHDDGLALRYDLTVPLSRLYASNRRELGQPFKRYQIQPVWRAERAQPKQGRFREFYQCDVDILGTKSLVADAEIVALANYLLMDIGFADVEVQVNHRKLLGGMIEYCGFDSEHEASVCLTLDKLDKIGEAKVRKELSEKGHNADKIDKLFSVKACTLDQFAELDNSRIRDGVDDLREFFRLCRFYGKGSENIIFSSDLARGLDYYTGIIFEAKSKSLPHIGSLAGGGRYDELIGVFDSEDIPAVGITIGLDRILVAMQDAGLLSKAPTITKVLFTYFSDETLPAVVASANMLRDGGIPTEIYLQNAKMGKQFSYADRMGIPIVITIGPDEMAKNVAMVKNMKKGEQAVVDLDNLAEGISEILAKLDE